MVGPHCHAYTKHLKKDEEYLFLSMPESKDCQKSEVENDALNCFLPGKYSFATVGNSYSESILSTPCFLRQIRDCDNISLAYN